MKLFKKDNTLVNILAVGIVIIALVLAFGSKSSVNISGSGQAQQNTISVSGQAEMTVDSDQAELYVKIETTKTTAQEAKDENSETSESVESALRREGVKKEEIETSRYSIHPKYDYNRVTGKSTLVGYTVTNVLKVTTNDMDNIGELIDAAVDAGANGFDQISFGLSEEKQEDVNAAVLLKASDEAAAKAKSLAKNLNVNLGKLSSITESNFYYAPYRYAMADVEEAVFAKGAPVPTSISPQDVTVRATVSLAYEIE